jgi:hypothetical protein
MLFQKLSFRTFLEPWLRKEKKMLKKTLIAVAILGFVVPAFAADTYVTKKYHEFVPKTTYEWQTVSTVNVCMDVGYWIQIDFRGKCIEVVQDSSLGGKPFESYSGCLEDVAVTTNFNATLKADAAAQGSAGGKWSAKLDGASTYVTGGSGTFKIDICVAGTEVKIAKLDVSKDKQTVAIVTVKVLPTGFSPA